MAKREIRVSIFFTDMHVYLLMQHKKRYDEMLKQANEFYGKYKLRIDSIPFPYNYMAYQEAFVLSQGQGIKPDMGQDQLAADMRADTEESRQISAKLADPNISADERRDLLTQRAAVDKKIQSRVWQGVNSNGEHDFRMAIGKRLSTNKMLKMRAQEWRKSPRLVVIICEFIQLAVRSKTNTDTVGMYVDGLTSAKARVYERHDKPVPEFRAPFVIMDVGSANWHTFCHEIAHGNGHSHPDGQFGGLYDGPAESIYNYQSSVMPPSKVILEPSDLKTLEQAFFVR